MGFQYVILEILKPISCTQKMAHENPNGPQIAILGLEALHSIYPEGYTLLSGAHTEAQASGRLAPRIRAVRLYRVVQCVLCNGTTLLSKQTGHPVVTWGMSNSHWVGLHKVRCMNYNAGET